MIKKIIDSKFLDLKESKSHNQKTRYVKFTYNRTLCVLVITEKKLLSQEMFLCNKNEEKIFITPARAVHSRQLALVFY